jgi:hypothetical protein
MFSVKPGLLRFQMNSYRPVTKSVKDGSTVSIVMEQAADALWTPPVCKLTPDWFRGFVMAFRRPKNANTRRGHDIDYGTVVIRYKKNALRFGVGFNWSWGLPYYTFFDNIAELHERDIELLPDAPTAEYRGRRSDGSYFRFIGKAGETIEYDHARKEQADYFDSIMDTLCRAQDFYAK